MAVTGAQHRAVLATVFGAVKKSLNQSASATKIMPSSSMLSPARRSPIAPLIAQTRNFTMSLSRRACYKCGNVGHFAENCSSIERLCYNCKQPGHESSQCPLPRSSEAKQCYHCQGLGHVQADCPTYRLNGAESAPCYNCGQPGHIARACPNPPSAGLTRRRPGPGSGSRHATCYKCGGPNHFARDCQAQDMKCYACGKTGHISRDCTAPNGGPLKTAGKTCYQCGESGHISRECPSKRAPGNSGDISAGGEATLA